MARPSWPWFFTGLKPLPQNSVSPNREANGLSRPLPFFLSPISTNYEGAETCEFYISITMAAGSPITSRSPRAPPSWGEPPTLRRHGTAAVQQQQRHRHDHQEGDHEPGHAAGLAATEHGRPCFRSGWRTLDNRQLVQHTTAARRPLVRPGGVRIGLMRILHRIASEKRAKITYRRRRRSGRPAGRCFPGTRPCRAPRTSADRPTPTPSAPWPGPAPCRGRAAGCRRRPS